MKIVIAPLAAQDLQEAHDFVALDNPHAADRLVARIMESEFIRGRPERYPLLTGADQDP